MSLWKQVIKTVEAHRRHGDLHKAIVQAAMLFEKAQIDPALGTTLNLSQSRGWTDDVAAEPVDLAARDELVTSLKNLAKERPDDPGVGGIFWALGKVGDASLVPFLQEALMQHLARNPGTVFQIMIALENYGQRVFKDNCGMSINNVVENINTAKAYLASL